MQDKKFIFISDTHTLHEEFEIPEGDFIIHAGDISSTGTVRQIAEFLDWFSALPHKYKIMIPGNHDFLFETDPEAAYKMCNDRDIICLIDESIEIEGIRFWGSPISPWFNNWAFNRYRGSTIQHHWCKIPNDVDILITHGPAAYMENNLSTTADFLDVGCEDLYSAIQRVKPKIHAFGHIHEGYGVHETPEIIYINCSLLNRNYGPVNKPITVNYKNGEYSVAEDYTKDQ